MDDNKFIDDDDSGDKALLAVIQSQKSGQGNSPPSCAAFPLHQPMPPTQWSQTQEWSQTQATLIPSQLSHVHGPFGLPLNAGHNLAGLPSGIANESATTQAPMRAPSVMAKKKQGVSCKAGSKGHTQEETMCLLDLMEEHIPVGTKVCETIACVLWSRLNVCIKGC